jgi:hypothetical protein
MRAARGHGCLVVAVAGKGKGGVGQRKDEPAVADLMAVEVQFGCTVMRMTARPGSQDSSSMPMVSREARSAANMVWPTCRRAARAGTSLSLDASSRSFSLELRRALLQECRHTLDVVVGAPMADCVSRSTSSCASSVRWFASRSSRAGGHQGLAWAWPPGAGPGPGGCQAVVGHVPDQPPFLGLRGRQLVAGHGQPHGACQAQALREEPGAARRRGSGRSC